MSTHHRPVMVEETLDFLVRRPAGLPSTRLVDCTAGGGGHAAALLAASPTVELLAVDRDPEAIERAAAVLAPFAGRVDLQVGDYRRLSRLIEKKTGRGRSAASSPTSASPRTSSTIPGAASRSPETGRSTCEWTEVGTRRPRRTSFAISLKKSWRGSSAGMPMNRTLAALREPSPSDDGRTRR